MNKNSSFNYKKIAFIAVVAIIAVLAAYGVDKITGSKKEGAQSSNEIAVAKDSDIVIPVASVTENPAFYPAVINGTDLEVIAVKASDGTIRTAFNTCQVCYSSGKGYYKQEGNQLVCQNCGNRFGMDDVEVTKGGCNPVPITSEYKTVDNETITISKDFLTQATVIFENWSNGK